MTQIEYTPADVETFWSRVDKNGPVPAHRPELGPCWIWTRAKQTRGYGTFWIASARRPILAHRFAFTVSHHPISPHLKVCHACDNPSCVRPSHLFPGTQKDNLQDARAKGRMRIVIGPSGDSHHSAKVTADDVRIIRRRIEAGESQRMLAREYDLSESAMSSLALRQTWKHVT